MTPFRCDACGEAMPDAGERYRLALLLSEDPDPNLNRPHGGDGPKDGTAEGDFVTVGEESFVVRLCGLCVGLKVGAVAFIVRGSEEVAR